jgi:ribosomal protein L44E
VVLLHVPRGNAPTCPECGHWNALLDKTEHTVDKIILYYECRDCGYTVLAEDCLEVPHELFREEVI